ncbi:MAG TPA: hydroxymethylbilane synthase, partial [Planctomycetes bacterium]|nr:hydroxymethylbilane synthase [Planctomycetota bacterium]
MIPPSFSMEFLMKTLRIGTRGSDLALWQARHISSLLEASGEVRCELVIVKTSGDRIQDVPLTPELGKGFFTKEIEDGLLADHFDLAVHSLKDLAVRLAPGLVLAAVPRRGPVGERLLLRKEAFDTARANRGELPLAEGAKVGTSSLRRRRRLLDLRPDLQILDLRGNVPTRVRKLQEGQYDAILIAQAGLERLALPTGGLIAFDIDARLFPGAPGQGALGLEARAEDQETLALLSKLEDPQTRVLTDIERGVLQALGGGCSLPLGTLATLLEEGDQPRYRLDAFAYGREDQDPGISIILESGDSHSLIQEAVRFLAPALEKPLVGRELHLVGGSGRSNLGSDLEAAGAKVHRHRVYDIHPLPVPEETWDRLAQQDALLFSSPSAIELGATPLLRALGPRPPKERLAKGDTHSSAGPKRDTHSRVPSPAILVPGRSSRLRAEALLPGFVILEAQEKNARGMARLAIQRGWTKIGVLGARDGSPDAIQTAKEAGLQVLHVPLYQASPHPRPSPEPLGDTLFLSPKAARLLPPQG